MKRSDFILILLFLFFIFFLYTSYIDSGKVRLYFIVNETKINGEVFIENRSMGNTKNGKISVLQKELREKISFKPDIDNQYYIIDFFLDEESVRLGKMYFLIPEDKLGEGYTYLYFNDNKTGCEMNGDIYIDNEVIGSTTNGSFLLFKNYLENKNNLSIRGYTSDCFEDTGFLYYRTWNINNLTDIFEYSKVNLILLDYSPRQPIEYIEMQDFIRLEETESFIDKMNKSLVGPIEKDLDILSKTKIKYIEDIDLFGEMEYWQTPYETLSRGEGDCEDWAITILSLMRKYNNNIDCYNLLWRNHVSIFCYFDNNFIIYDQDKTKFKTKLDLIDDNEYNLGGNRNRIREMRDDYFRYYGLKGDERDLFLIFNEKEMIVVNENEDFLDWALDLVL